MTVYLIFTYTPYEEKTSFCLEVCNEIFIVFVQYHMFLFTEMVPNVEIRNEMGYSCVLFTCAILLINLLTIVGTSIKAMLLKCRRCMVKRKNIKAMRVKMLDYKR